MLMKLAKALWQDYAPKIGTLHQQIQEHDDRLKELGTESGQAFNDLFQELKDFKQKQYDIFEEIFSIYEEVMKALKDVDNGREIRGDTGLTRSIGNPELREKVRYYFEAMQA